MTYTSACLFVVLAKRSSPTAQAYFIDTGVFWLANQLS